MQNIHDTCQRMTWNCTYGSLAECNCTNWFCMLLFCIWNWTNDGWTRKGNEMCIMWRVYQRFYLGVKKMNCLRMKCVSNVWKYGGSVDYMRATPAPHFNNDRLTISSIPIDDIINQGIFIKNHLPTVSLFFLVKSFNQILSLII